MCLIRRFIQVLFILPGAVGQQNSSEGRLQEVKVKEEKYHATILKQHCSVYKKEKSKLKRLVYCVVRPFTFLLHWVKYVNTLQSADTPLKSQTCNKNRSSLSLYNCLYWH